MAAAKKKVRVKSPFEKARSIEANYARDLRRVAREIGRIINSFPPGDPRTLPRLKEALGKYADAIRPWAEARADTMLKQINFQDERAWRQATAQMSAGIRDLVNTAPVGRTFRALKAEQVALITSLPIEAAQRVQKLTTENLITGTRSKELIAEIMRSGEVTKSRATLIARTETARSASMLTETRARRIQSLGYIWRTAHDGDVRPSHKKMEGKYVSWDSPPTLDNLTGHAGCLPNCRCYPEPVIPAELE